MLGWRPWDIHSSPYLLEKSILIWNCLGTHQFLHYWWGITNNWEACRRPVWVVLKFSELLKYGLWWILKFDRNLLMYLVPHVRHFESTWTELCYVVCFRNFGWMYDSNVNFLRISFLYTLCHISIFIESKFADVYSPGIEYSPALLTGKTFDTFKYESPLNCITYRLEFQQSFPKFEGMFKNVWND